LLVSHKTTFYCGRVSLVVSLALTGRRTLCMRAEKSAAVPGSSATIRFFLVLQSNAVLLTGFLAHASRPHNVYSL